MTKLMKSSVMIVCLFCFVNQINAQMRIGLRAGAPTVSTKSNYNEFWMPESGMLYGLNYESTHTSYSYGLGFYNEITDNVWLMGETLLRKKTVNYNVEMLHDLSRSNDVYQDKIMEFSVPFAAGITFNNFKLGLGPVFNFKAKADFGLTEIEGFQSKNKKHSTGFQFLIGYKINEHIHVDLKRELSFTSNSENYDIMDNPFKKKTSPHHFTLNFGIFL